MDISIGKYTLESLTSGMYLDPLSLYKEYIQNAVDSLDEAIEAGMATGIGVDCDKLSNMLVPGRYDSYDLLATLRYVTDIQLRREKKGAHYFRVT